MTLSSFDKHIWSVCYESGIVQPWGFNIVQYRGAASLASWSLQSRSDRKTSIKQAHQYLALPVNFVVTGLIPFLPLGHLPFCTLRTGAHPSFVSMMLCTCGVWWKLKRCANKWTNKWLQLRDNLYNYVKGSSTPQIILLIPQCLTVLRFKIFTSGSANPHCHSMGDDWFYSDEIFYAGLISFQPWKGQGHFWSHGLCDWNHLSGGSKIDPLECKIKKKKRKTRKEKNPYICL